MAAITIAREYGSCGAAIGAQVAERLGWRYIDDELIYLVAARAGVDDGQVRPYDQDSFSRFTSLAHDWMTMIDLVSPRVVARSLESANDPDAQLSPELHRFYSGRYLTLLQQMMSAVAAEGKAVVMGRGAHVILREMPGCLHVRLVSPWDVRVRRVALREGVNDSEAARMIHRRDGAVTRYLHHYYRVNGTEPHLYDLVLNTARMTQNEAVRLITEAASQRGNQYHMSNHNLRQSA